MEITIRQRQPEDDAERHALGDFCERTADAEMGGCGLQYDFHPTTDLTSVNLVAMDREQIVGFLDGDVVMMPDETGKVVALDPLEGYIHCIGVHPDYRRQGVGRQLLRAALREYEKAGAVRVELCTPSSTAAECFAACGGRRFEHPGVIDRSDGGSFEWRLPLDR